jgi:uncharacterized membrane protein YphA (DoxX/SURF4 family)
MNKKYLLILFRILTGIIFAYAGFSKLIEPYENFRGMINHYEVIPYAWSSPVALILPWFEFVFGIFMILGYFPKMTSLVLAGLSLSFLLVLGASNVLLEEAGKDCGCFGQMGPIHLKVWQVFIMDMVLFGFSLYHASLKNYDFSLDSLFKK